MLVQLAEHLAIRFALEQFDHGEVKVNAVRQMLDRMNQEIENLRKILGSHENNMTDAGILAESHREILDRQFWAAVPDSGKQSVLLSEEAWCIPPRNVQSYVTDLIEKGNIADAVSILQNYAACADSKEPDARKKTAVGLSEIAELYSKADPRLLSEALRHLGLRLSVEQDAEVQGVVSAAFVRLSQEAATSRAYSARWSRHWIWSLEWKPTARNRPQSSQQNGYRRTRAGVCRRSVTHSPGCGRADRSVANSCPKPRWNRLSARFNRCSHREDADNIANLAGDLGEEGFSICVAPCAAGPSPEAVEMAGLLSRLDPQAVQVFLPGTHQANSHAMRKTG